MTIHLLRNRDYKADMRLLHFYSFRLGNVTFQATPISSKPKKERKKNEIMISKDFRLEREAFEQRKSH